MIQLSTSFIKMNSHNLSELSYSRDPKYLNQPLDLSIGEFVTLHQLLNSVLNKEFLNTLTTFDHNIIFRVNSQMYNSMFLQLAWMLTFPHLASIYKLK